MTNMLTNRIIPCLDVKNGHVVKGIQFQGLRDAGDPAQLAARYESQGADELVLLDISATPEGRKTQIETVKQVRAELSIPLTVGGGVHSPDHAGTLLESGADKVSVNTAAIRSPDLITQIATQYGSQCAILALDAARKGNTWEVVIMSGNERTGINAIEWAKEAIARGAGEILLTSWDKDGTRSGYDYGLLEAISDVVPVPVIASGGAATPDHLVQAIHAGADAVLAASIFHDGDYTIQSIKHALQAHGIKVRL